MTEEYIHVTGQDGETYDVLPTEALLSFLQRMAEDEAEEQGGKLETQDLAYRTGVYH
jgi:hypothetical protein